METVHKHYSLDELTKIQTVETLVSQCSIVPAVFASRSKDNRIALSTTQVVCGLTMLRGIRHKLQTYFVLSGQVCPIWASMSSKQKNKTTND